MGERKERKEKREERRNREKRAGDLKGVITVFSIIQTHGPVIIIMVMAICEIETLLFFPFF